MSENDYDIVAALWADIKSPNVVAAIDRALEAQEQVRLDLLDLRKMAVRRHGDTPQAGDVGPKNQAQHEQPAAKSEEPQANTKDESTSKPRSSDGSFAYVVERYRTDEHSTYHELRHATRQTYDSLMRRLIEDCGKMQVAELNARSVLRLHEGWKEGGKFAMGHALIGMFRTIINFGAVVLEDKECERLSNVLHKMRFKMARPREASGLTREHVVAIIAKAHEMKVHSIALAQAFQFDCKFRQKDVIGEWVPKDEQGDSDVIEGDQKWLRGLRWNEIDDDLILLHITSRSGTKAKIDLKKAPFVTGELEYFWERPKTGPIIVFERSGKPYLSHQFRRMWREVATAAGVPKDVMNMDTRLSEDE